MTNIVSIVWLVWFITTTVDYIGVWWYFDKQQRTFNRLLLAVFLTSSVYYNYCRLHWYLWWYFAGNGEGGCGAEDEHSFLALTVDWEAPHRPQHSTDHVLGDTESVWVVDFHCACFISAECFFIYFFACYPRHFCQDIQ